MEFEIIEIYPYNTEILKNIKKFQKENNKKNGVLQESGTVHAYCKDLKLDIKNIRYKIFLRKNDKKIIIVHMPGQTYMVEDKKMFVPTISFENKEIEERLKNLIKEEIKSL